MFTTGDPLLPPMMSAVATKLNGVSRFSLAFFSTHRGGSSNGYLFPCSALRPYSPASVVYGGTGLPASVYPLTVPNASRRVNVASG